MPRNTKLEVGEAKPVFDEPRSRDSRSRTLFRFDTTTIEIKEKINPALESKEKGDDAEFGAQRKATLEIIRESRM